MRFLSYAVRIIISILVSHTTARPNMFLNSTYPIVPEWQTGILPKIYDKTEPPTVDEKITVYLRAFNVNMEAFDLSKMGIHGSFHLNVTWTDCRLNFPSDLPHELILPDFAEQFWTPSFLFRNCRNCNPLVIDIDETDIFHVEGKLRSTLFVTEFFTCNIYLWRYPMDTHWCHMEIQFYQFQEKLNLRIDKEVSLDGDDTVLQLYVVEANTSPCNKSLLPDDIQPCVSVSIRIERNMPFHFINIMFPSSIIVFSSWASFYIIPTEAPTRITMGLMTVLALCNRFASLSSKLPVGIHVKASDVWMNVTLSFVFVSLLTYVRALLNHQRANKVTKINVGTANEDEFVKKPGCCSKWSIDMKARILFPIAFIIFNIIYWSVYL